MVNWSSISIIWNLHINFSLCRDLYLIFTSSWSPSRLCKQKIQSSWGVKWDSVQVAANLRGLCWVCGVHPALAASEGLPRGRLGPRSAQTFPCCVTRSSTIQQPLISTKMLVSLLVRHLMSTSLQFISVVMQLNRWVCNCNSERQGDKVLWVSDP